MLITVLQSILHSCWLAKYS